MRLERNPNGNDYRRGSDAFARVLSFSDGVMTIAITLLVLNINLPIPGNEQLAAQADIPRLLQALLPKLNAFLVSFVVVAYAWVGHHRLLAGLERIDNVFIAWNFVYLLLVVLVPLQSQLIGLYDSNANALSVYSLGFALLFLCDLVGLRLSWSRRLVARRPSRRLRLHATLARLVPVLVFVSTVGMVQVLGTGIANWLWLAIWPLGMGLDQAFGMRS